MTAETAWGFPDHLRPQAEALSFDLQPALDAMLSVRAEVPEDAFTAASLGTERIGNGIAIGTDGLVLTIGYLITEASAVWLTTNQGQVCEAHPLAYDQASGLGLLLPLQRLSIPTLSIGSATALQVDRPVSVISHGGQAHALQARVVSCRTFAGYWEYVLERAIYTAPAHPQWGGSALLDEAGQLVGVGSLLVEEARAEGQKQQGNLFVPIDLLTPIYDALLKTGRRPGPPRPWLGLYAAPTDGALVVGALAEGGPAQRAGLRVGDLLLEIADQRVTDMAAFWHALWSLGSAGVSVPLTVARHGRRLHIRVESMDREDILKKPRLH